MTETHSSGDTIHTQIGAGATNVNVGKNINQTIYQLTPAQPVDAMTRAAAQAKLAALPLDVVPPVATLPSGSRLPLSPNPLFVGRDEALQQLARTLKGDASPAFDQVRLAAVTGWGGLGKTQLAVEFAHRYGPYFVGGVFWLNFASADGVPAQVALCGGRGALNLGVDFASLDLDTQVALVLAAWQNALPYLLIFDNCEEPALLERWRPPTGAARILVTSRRAEWDDALNVQTLPLAVLSRPESVQLLLSLRPDASDALATLDAIATELGDLPLALHLAGGYLKQYRHRVTPAAYLAELRGPALLQHRSLQEGRHAATLPTHHERNVARTFALSYDRLDAADALDALAMKLLARAAYFAPGVVMPRSLLLTSVGIARTPAPGTELDQALQAEDALHRLVELGLLESEAGGTLRLHRLLARFVQATSTDRDAQADVEQAMIHLAYDDNVSGYPARLLAWQPHLRHVTDRALRRNDQQAATLAVNLGYHLQAMGELAAARPYYEQALAILERQLGPQHPTTRIVRRNLEGLRAAIEEKGA